MKTLNVNYSKQDVKIYIENGLLNNVTAFLNNDLRYYLITDANVAALYLDKLQIKNIDYYQIKNGEASKNLDEVKAILEDMISKDINKNDFIICFGGGVVGDISAFVASIYKRGIRYINIPTTLLSQVDSCLGGKCGVDIHVKGFNYKNQIGGIYHPETILIDPLVLNTLPRNELLSGLGEVIKYGLCFDKRLFAALFQEFSLERIILQCLIIKAKITSSDEFDQNQRLALNFGHTIGHALEGLLNYKIAHGLAVAIGMYHEVKDDAIKTSLQTLYKHLGFELDLEIDSEAIKDYILKDKKISHEDINLPVLNEIGNVTIIKTKLADYLRSL